MCSFIDNFVLNVIESLFAIQDYYKQKINLRIKVTVKVENYVRLATIAYSRVMNNMFTLLVTIIIKFIYDIC